MDGEVAEARPVPIYRGISWNVRKRQWMAQASIDGERRLLGYFPRDRERDAGMAYADAIGFAAPVLRSAGFPGHAPIEWPEEDTPANRLRLAHRIRAVRIAYLVGLGRPCREARRVVDSWIAAGLVYLPARIRLVKGVELGNR